MSAIEDRDSEKMLEIGEKLAAVRKARGLTQVQAAQKVGCTQSYLSSVENGKKAFSIGFVLRLISLYEVSYDSVFGENDAGRWEFEKPAAKGDAAAALELLQLLLESSGSRVLEKGTQDYLKLCIYNALRCIYPANPHNTGRLFEADEKAAAEAIARLTAQLPEVTGSLIESSRIKRKNIELPVERGHELRRFISECEELLRELDAL
ncbi:MAG: helix-turn-helix transcriptional regulator [Ruminococcus sp.]|nr:helix-turn-helix transcriptional regulator [Ruminococcus sp.]